MAEVAGKLGSVYISRLNCLSFDGTGDLVTITDSADFTFTTAQSFSIELWTNPTIGDLGNIVTSLSASSGFQVEVDSSGFIVFTVGDGSNTPSITGTTDVTATDADEDGKWHHVVCVRDVVNDKLYLYVDGSSDQTAVTDTTTGNIDGGDVIFGGATSTGFEGKVGEVTLWNAALSAANVTAQYNSGNGVVNDVTMNSDKDISAISVWHVSEGTGATVRDIGTGNHHGTITNAAWSTWAITVTDEAVGTGTGSQTAYTLDNANADNVVVSVNAVVQGAETYTVTPAGALNFDTAPGGGLAIIATYTYGPVAEVGGFMEWSLDQTADALDTTDFTDDGWRTFIVGLKQWSATAGRHWLHPWVVPYLGERGIVKLYMDATDHFEGWAILIGLNPTVAVDDIINEPVSFQGSGNIDFQTS
jgi:hypothetical protein